MGIKSGNNQNRTRLDFNQATVTYLTKSTSIDRVFRKLTLKDFITIVVINLCFDTQLLTHSSLDNPEG